MAHRLLLRALLTGLSVGSGLIVAKVGLWWSDHYPTSPAIELWYKVLIALSLAVAFGGSYLAFRFTKAPKSR